MRNFTIGCDPEVFLKDTKTGDVVPSYGIVPGTKYEPYEENGTLVSVDGVAAEIGIEPARTANEFVEKVNQAMSLLTRIIAPRYEVLISSGQMIKEEYLRKVPEEVLQLGCEPDLDAYTGAIFNVDEIHQRKGSMFYCGGHIHLGWTEGEDTTSKPLAEDCRTLAIALDYYLGAPLKGISSEIGRSSVYETPGRYRIKPYGMEYRTPSNAWLKADEYIQFVFNSAKRAFQDLNSKKRVNLRDPVRLPNSFTSYDLYPSTIIRNSDTYNGRKLFEFLKESFA